MTKQTNKRVSTKEVEATIAALLEYTGCDSFDGYCKLVKQEAKKVRRAARRIS